MENSRLIKKTGIYLIGNLSSKILSVILVPLYAFYINAESLGNFDYSQTLTNILVPIFFIAIWEAILKFLLSEQEKKEKIIATSAIFSIMQAIVLCIVMVLYYTFINDNNYKYYIITMLISHGIANIWQYFARGVKENKLYVLSGVVSTLINFIFNVVLICILKMQEEALYIAYIMGNLSIFIVIETKLHIIKNIAKKNIDKKLLKKMLLFSAPLVINLISGWLISGFGRIIVTKVLGTTQNGLYAFGNKFSVIVTFIGSVLNMAIIEETIITVKEDKISKSFSDTIQLIFEKFMQLLLLAIPIITIFYIIIKDTEYYESRKYFSLLLIYALLMSMSTNIGSIFQAIDKTKYISLTTIIGAFFTVVISLIFIKFYGVMAVVIAQTIGAFIMLILRYKMAQKFVDIKIKWRNIILLTLTYIFISIICLQCNWIINVIIEFMLIVAITYVNKKYITDIKNFLSKKIKRSK